MAFPSLCQREEKTPGQNAHHWFLINISKQEVMRILHVVIQKTKQKERFLQI